MKNSKSNSVVDKTVVDLLDEASRKQFGADNRIYLHQKWNLISFWIMSGIGLLYFIWYAISFPLHHFASLVWVIPTLILYWFLLFKYGLPHFESNNSKFLATRYGKKPFLHWGNHLDWLDNRDIIKIAKMKRCFRIQKMKFLVDFFSIRSQKAKIFFNPSSAAFHAWGASIIGTLIVNLMSEIFKVGDMRLANAVTFFLISLGTLTALFVFIANCESRRLERLSELLRIASLQAPR